MDKDLRKRLEKRYVDLKNATDYKYFDRETYLYQWAEEARKLSDEELTNKIDKLDEEYASMEMMADCRQGR